VSNRLSNLHIKVNKENAILGLILMIGHIFGNGCHMPLVQLFSGYLSTMAASMEHSILNDSAFIQQKSAEWPASQGGPLPDLQQYESFGNTIRNSSAPTKD
jgi:hypothetical protein